MPNSEFTLIAISLSMLHLRKCASFILFYKMATSDFELCWQCFFLFLKCFHSQSLNTPHCLLCRELWLLASARIWFCREGSHSTISGRKRNNPAGTNLKTSIHRTHTCQLKWAKIRMLQLLLGSIINIPHPCPTHIYKNWKKFTI